MHRQMQENFNARFEMNWMKAQKRGSDRAQVRIYVE